MESAGFSDIGSALAGPGDVNVAAFFVVLAAAMYSARRRDLDERAMYWAGVWGIAGALAGQPLFNVVASPGMLLEPGWREALLYTGPRGVYSAFIGAGIAGFVYLRATKRSLLCYADAAVPAVLLGYVVARIACFMAGDCFGTVSDMPWAVTFPRGTEAFQTHLQRDWIGPESGRSLTVHPTQWYHALAGLAGFALLVKWRPAFAGDRLAVALVFYGTARFIIQFYRDEYRAGGAAVDQAQWFCIAFVISGLLLWARNRWVAGRDRVIAVS